MFLPGEPRDGGAWWAAVCGVAQSRTWLSDLAAAAAAVLAHTPQGDRAVLVSVILISFFFWPSCWCVPSSLVLDSGHLFQVKVVRLHHASHSSPSGQEWVMVVMWLKQSQSETPPPNPCPQLPPRAGFFPHRGFQEDICHSESSHLVERAYGQHEGRTGCVVPCLLIQSCRLRVTLWTVAPHAPHRILQARILEWVAMASPRRSSRPRAWICTSCVSCTGRWVFTTIITWEESNNRGQSQAEMKECWESLRRTRPQRPPSGIFLSDVGQQFSLLLKLTWVGLYCLPLKEPQPILMYLPFELLSSSIRNLPAIQETWVQFLGWEDHLEKEVATHSSILAWKTPWTEEPGRLQSVGSQESDMVQWLNHSIGFPFAQSLACV